MGKLFWLVCLAVWMLTGAPMAEAAQERGSIRVKLDTGDLPVINGAVTLYRIGQKEEDGYRISDQYGGGILMEDNADAHKLALWLAETANDTGTPLLLDADGTAIFSDLDEGLYLLVQTERIDGFYPIYPVLLTIPQEENRALEIHREPVPVVTEIPQTGQSPIPFLGVLGMILSSLGLMVCAKKGRKQ